MKDSKIFLTVFQQKIYIERKKYKIICIVYLKASFVKKEKKTSNIIPEKCFKNSFDNE